MSAEEAPDRAARMRRAFICNDRARAGGLRRNLVDEVPIFGNIEQNIASSQIVDVVVVDRRKEDGFL